VREICEVGPWLADAALAEDLSTLVKPGSIAKLKATN